MDRLAERLQFAVGQVTECTAWDRAELQRTNACSDQLDDRVADLVEHLADDPVATFVDDDSDDRAAFGIADRADHLRDGALAVDCNASSEPVEHLRRRVAVEQCFVLLVDPVARVHDTVGDLAIVGQ